MFKGNIVKGDIEGGRKREVEERLKTGKGEKKKRKMERKRRSYRGKEKDKRKGRGRTEEKMDSQGTGVCIVTKMRRQEIKKKMMKEAQRGEKKTGQEGTEKSMKTEE